VLGVIWLSLRQKLKLTGFSRAMGLEEIFRIEAGDVTMRFKKIWMGDMNGVKKVVLIKLEG
jgi:hypothetical protein